ncbi:hypothetical protein SAMD00019534_072370 [Acytostelium subglobosum LB1]|uniref:hypothetical protein n=1 Tax=Acytostelium subglobosum LB1 TaxID=1410327 RepID=UPI0006450F55|nr:hypothetical protein SAMD00019534_072370 [Acytostelium subglobosum LB1]GAM24062.1 hypothetical protein SAMD00019534_072370 [Acytostelium subglobosum LB1]|eukprot:XP_012753098.1 hypothetical protein SAMD00019534_072370 [Acytostelium subglobosum LB1]
MAFETSSSGDFACLTNEDCNNLGECIQNICHCNGYVSGSNCSTPFTEILGNSFTAFRLFFLISFILLTLYIIVNTYKSFHLWSHGKVGFKLKAINHLVILAFAILRIIYFSVDPWSNIDIFPYALSIFLYNFPLYLLFTSYQLFLLYWAGTYHSVSSVESGNIFIPKTKAAFIVCNGIWFGFEVAGVLSNLLKFSRSVSQIISLTFNIYLTMASVTIGIGFVIYGTLLYKRISKLQTNKEKKKATLRKLLIITIILSFSISCIIVPSIVFNMLKFVQHPTGALIYACFVHALECILTVEELVILKPRATGPNSNGTGNDKSMTTFDKRSSGANHTGSGVDTKSGADAENNNKDGVRKKLLCF